MIQSALPVPHGFANADLDVCAALPDSVRAGHLERIVAQVLPTRSALDVVLVRQVHGVGVHRATAAGGLRPVAEADALVSDTPGLVLVIRTADCAPVLVAGRTAVAAIHAGWRGLAGGVVQAAVAALRALDAGPLRAAVGPCIGPRHFEVGDEVVAALGPLAVVAGRSPRGRPLLDLGAGCQRALTEAGVYEVDRLSTCTVADPGWCSHRRDGDRAGRQASIIAVPT